MIPILPGLQQCSPSCRQLQSIWHRVAGRKSSKYDLQKKSRFITYKTRRKRRGMLQKIGRKAMTRERSKRTNHLSLGQGEFPSHQTNFTYDIPANADSSKQLIWGATNAPTIQCTDTLGDINTCLHINALFKYNLRFRSFPGPGGIICFHI